VRFHHAVRRAPILLAVIAASGLIAACGSSSSSSSSTASTGASSATSSQFAARRAALATCLKKYGVTLPSRPAGSRPPGTGTTPGAGGGGGFLFGGGTGARRQLTTKQRAAFQACGANFGFGARRAALTHTAITKFVTCVRQHGYNLPAPNFSGNGPTFPASIRTNAKFQAASRACASLLTPPGGFRPGGAGSTSTTSTTS
jgi:hypothetical protein